MQIRCLVEREGNRHVLRVEGIPYTFERNERGHLVTEVTNYEHIKWMMRSSSYAAYREPKVIHTGVVSEVAGEDLAHEPEPEQPEATEEAPAKDVRHKLRNPSRKKR